MSTTDEARVATIERADEWLASHRVSESWRVISSLRDEMVRQASRKVEAAPSDTDKEASLTEKASRHNLRDDTFMSILERLQEADGRDGPRHHLGNRAEAAGDLYKAAREHFPAQPVQVEITDMEAVITAAMRRSDDENHERLCACRLWPESCVTYGDTRPWSHDAEFVARAALSAALGGVRNGVCLLCGDGVLNNGEHIDPERHAAALGGGEPSNCNCGWGGTHDPDNPRCEANGAALGGGTNE